MYELQVDFVFYDDELVVMVFGIVQWVFSVVIVDVEHVGGTTVGSIWGVVGGGSTGVGGGGSTGVGGGTGVG